MLLVIISINVSFGQNEVSDSSLVDSINLVSKIDSSINDSTIVKVIKPPKKSNALNTTVNYDARDSIIMDVISRKAYLFGDAHVDYGKITLEANYIEIDWDKSEVFAVGRPDSIGGDTVGNPFFKEGSEEFVAKEMRYNFKTEKGIIKEAVTTEGEAFIHGKKIKINEKKELFINDAVYTTCNLEHPHFAIVSKKIKIVPDKLAVSGPFNIMIADVNTPLGGPFGIFPLPKEKTSGFILPSYGETVRTGFFLKDMGYYLAISDYVGLKLTGDIYTNSSWRASLETNYKKRYKYEGLSQVALTRLKPGFDEVTEKIPLGYKIYWKHTPRGTGNSKFTSSVNMQSANYNRENLFNINQTLKTNFTSAITYSKKFGKSPFNMNIKLRQDQRDSVQTYRLPDFGFTMSRQSPLKFLSKESTGFFNKFGISYNLTTQNQIKNQIFLLDSIGNETTTKRIEQIDFLNFSSLKNKSNTNVSHKIPITLPSFKFMKHFTVTPSANYLENWYFKKLSYTLDTNANTFVSSSESGFQRAYTYGFNANLNTRLYGYLNIPFLGIQRIKHTATPQISYSYRPDFSDEKYGYYQWLPDTLEELQSLNRFKGFTPSIGRQQSISFSLSNVFDARVRNKKDTSSAPTYMKLLDNLRMSSGYNLAADSMNLSALSMNARTKVKGVIFNIKSTHDFYSIGYDTVGRLRRVNEINTKNGRIEPRLTAFNISASTDLNPQKRKKEYVPKTELEELELKYIKENLDNYVDFDIPWSLRISYNIDWKKQLDTKTISQSLKANGDLSLTPKWKFTFSNVGYDFAKKAMLQPRVGVIRDLHCWEMRFNYQPFGYNRGYTFDINVKAQVLQSLKYSQKDNPTNR